MDDSSDLSVPLLMSTLSSSRRRSRRLVSPPDFTHPPEATQNDRNYVDRHDSVGLHDHADHSSAEPRHQGDPYQDHHHHNQNPSEVRWYSNPMQISAMISNFSTSYNVVNISLVLPLLEQLWSSSTNEEMKSAVASSLLAGMMVGQVLGGTLGDVTWCGRLSALLFVMMVQMVSSLASAFTMDYSQLIVWRFLLGIGAGGVYPLAAVLSAEQDSYSEPTHHHDDPNNDPTDDHPQHHSSDNHHHHHHYNAQSLHLVVLTFSMQGIGFLAVPCVTVALLYSTSNLQLVWRIILALGSIPGLVLMILQTYVHYLSRRNQRRNHHQSHHVRGAMVPIDDRDDENTVDNNSSFVVNGPSDNVDADDLGEIRIASLSSTLTSPQHNNELPSLERKGWWDAIRHEDDLFRKLLGTAGTWFLFDVLFYGNTLFQPIVIQAAFGSHDDKSVENPMALLRRTALDSLILTLIAVPGYAVAGMVLGSNTLGCSQAPRYVMLQGFAVMSMLYLIIGLGWTEFRHYPTLLVILYSLTFFFANYGPNTTTFVLPSLVYSPQCRSTLNGMSAAAGKFGAWTGATLFAPTADNLGDATVLILCSIIAILAFFMTLFFVPRLNDDGDLCSQQPVPLTDEDDYLEVRQDLSQPQPLQDEQETPQSAAAASVS